MFRIDGRKLSRLARAGITPFQTVNTGNAVKREKRKKTGNLEKAGRAKFSIHPLFLVVGVWYCFTGELFLFLLSCLVALQHECAHAFAAARLGYKLNKIVLMPFGAVIDGDLRGISLKDEIFVAAWGPLCNLFTAFFFAAVWWFEPTVYAFTDTAYYSSLAIALVNLLPAYPLDGGRILKCVLENFLSKTRKFRLTAEKTAERFCRAITLLISIVFFVLFTCLLAEKEFNPTLLAFGIFLIVGALGNRNKSAVYHKMDISCKDELSRGVELKRVAVLASCPIKNTFRYLSRGRYLVLEVYDDNERHLFDLSQNELSELFLSAENPYTPLLEFGKNAQNHQKIR